MEPHDFLFSTKTKSQFTLHPFTFIFYLLSFTLYYKIYKIMESGHLGGHQLDFCLS